MKVLFFNFKHFEADVEQLQCSDRLNKAGFGHNSCSDVTPPGRTVARTTSSSGGIFGNPE
jgi:hypothetical protein